MKGRLKGAPREPGKPITGANSGSSAKGRRSPSLAGRAVPRPQGISEDRLRRLVRRTAIKIGPERLVRILAEVRAALKAEDLASARRAGSRCRMASHRAVMEQLLALAGRGRYVQAANLALQAGLFAYEDSLDHLCAFYEYEHDLGLTRRAAERP